MYQYLVGSRMWNATTWLDERRPINPIEVIHVHSHEDGVGTDWEVEFKWYHWRKPLGHPAAMKMEVFDDGFKAMIEKPGFFQDLAVLVSNGHGSSPELVIRLLNQHGFTDTTEERRVR